MNQPDEDALWRSIVENYGERAMPDLGGAVDSEPDAATPGGAEPTGHDPAPDPVHDPAARIDRDRIVEPATDASGDRLDAWDDPEDHFVPPEPPPLPHPEPPQLLAWAGVFGVPVLTVLLAVLRVPVPAWATLLAMVWFVGGFAFLVATMRRDRDEDDWDDGAVL